MEIDDTCMEVDFADMDDCRRTITLESGEKQILPNIVDITSWSKDLSDLPDVNYCDILVYFMNICLWSEQRLTKYKEDEGYKLFTDTHIDYVTMHKVDHNYCYIKSVCTPQDRQNDAPYITWVLVHEEGRVKAGGCNCVA